MKDSRKDNWIYIDHIISHSLIIERLAADKTSDSEAVFLAIVRCLEVIGEAARNSSPDFREKYPDVPWPEMIGLRNRLIHGYFGIKEEIVWNIARNEIPKLRMQLQNIQKREYPNAN